MAITVDRTYICGIRNQSQVSDPLDFAGFAASKFWNVARWTAGRIWDETGRIPGSAELQSYLQSHKRYKDLHSHSAQRVLQELDEAFQGWYGHRKNGNETANPPGYRKHNDEHPRTTVTYKRAGFKLDPNDYIRLSKGPNAKAYWSYFILCAIDAQPTIPDAERIDVRQVRAVYNGDEWELHLVCKVEMDDPDSPGDHVAGVDLGICNFAAVSYGDETALYPGGSLKEDEYYFAKKRAEWDDSFSREAQRLDRKRTNRRTHFLHTLSKDLVQQCKGRGVGTIVVGDSVVFDQRRTATPATGATTRTSICTDGCSTDSRISSRTRPKPKESRLNPSRNGKPQRRVRRATPRTTASAFTEDCPSATSVAWSPMQTVTARRTSDTKVLPNPSRIGITAVWHSQQSADSTLRRDGSFHKDRRTTNRNIPTRRDSTGTVTRGGCQSGSGARGRGRRRMSRSGRIGHERVVRDDYDCDAGRRRNGTTLGAATPTTATPRSKPTTGRTTTEQTT